MRRCLYCTTTRKFSPFPSILVLKVFIFTCFLLFFLYSLPGLFLPLLIFILDFLTFLYNSLIYFLLFYLLRCSFPSHILSLLLFLTYSYLPPTCYCRAFLPTCSILIMILLHALSHRSFFYSVVAIVDTTI